MSEHVRVALHFRSVVEHKYFRTRLIFHLAQQSVSVAKRGCLGKEYVEQSKYSTVFCLLQILSAIDSLRFLTLWECRDSLIYLWNLTV